MRNIINNVTNEEFKNLVNIGHTEREIATKLQCSISYVKKRKRQLKIKRPRSVDSIINKSDELRQRILNGESEKGIAEYFGCSVGVVILAKKKLKLRNKDLKISSKMQQLLKKKSELQALIEQGFTEKELAKYFDVSLGLIMSAKKKFHLLSHILRKDDPHNLQSRKTEGICLSCGKKSKKRHCSSCTNKRSMICIKQILVEENGGKCSKCGYDKCQAALDFHHIDPSQKEMNLAMSASTKNINKKREECRKCVLLCSNCHREEHWKTNLDFIKKNKEKIEQTKTNILRNNGNIGGPKK